MSSVDTLLTLMDHVDDVNQLEVFLEAKNLQRIMHAAGHDDAAMRRMIAAGETPGTMLLGVFKSGRTADEMMALIPPEDRIVEPAKKSASTPGPKSASTSRSLASSASATPGDKTQPNLGGLLLVMGGAIVSGVAVKLPMLGLYLVLYWPVVLGVLAVLGGIGGAILIDRRRSVGALVGSLCAPLATYLSYRYVGWMSVGMERDTLLVIEPILVVVVVVLLIFTAPILLWSTRPEQS